MPIKRGTPSYGNRKARRFYRTAARQSAARTIQAFLRRRMTTPGVSIIKQMYGNPAPLGERIYTSLEYAYSDVLTPSAAYYDKVFRMNSCYDPDYTGAGAQPIGFDEMMAFFQKCRVNDFEIDVTIVNNSTSALQVTLAPVNVITSYTNIDQIRAAPGAKSVYCMPAATQTKPLRITLKAKPRDIIGCTKVEYQDGEFYCTTSADPTHTPFCHVFLGSLNGAVNVNAYISYRMKFKSEFYDRRQLALS